MGLVAEFILKGEAVPKKNRYHITKQGRFYPDKKYTDWVEDCGYQIIQQKVPKIAAEKIRMNAIFYITRDKDIDNILGGLSDLLEKNGVVDNDKHIASVEALKIKVKSDPRIVIQLTIL